MNAFSENDVKLLIFGGLLTEKKVADFFPGYYLLPNFAMWGMWMSLWLLLKGGAVALSIRPLIGKLVIKISNKEKRNS